MNTKHDFETDRASKPTKAGRVHEIGRTRDGRILWSDGSTASDDETQRHRRPRNYAKLSPFEMDYGL